MLGDREARGAQGVGDCGVVLGQRGVVAVLPGRGAGTSDPGQPGEERGGVAEGPDERHAVGGEAPLQLAEALVQPPHRGLAGLAHAGRGLGFVDVDDDDRAAGGGPGQSGVVGEAEVVVEPDEGQRFGVGAPGLAWLSGVVCLAWLPGLVFLAGLSGLRILVHEVLLFFRSPGLPSIGSSVFGVAGSRVSIRPRVRRASLCALPGPAAAARPHRDRVCPMVSVCAPRCPRLPTPAR